MLFDPVAGRETVLPNDKSRNLHLYGFVIRVVNSVVAYQGIRENYQLAGKEGSVNASW